VQLSIGSIILYSSNRTKLASFLADLFDIEIDLGGEGVHSYTMIKNMKFSIKIFDGIFVRGSDLVEFHLRDTVELEAMCNRVKFARYRVSDNISDGEDINIKIEHDPSPYFDFDDIDGRRWRFLVG
jgi:hypothetical protein